HFLTLILYSEDVATTGSCQGHCGGVMIAYPFGIGESCYLEKYYEIKCLNSTTSGKLAPFLSINNKEVVNISLPVGEAYYMLDSIGLVDSLSFGSIRVKIPITSTGCGGKELPESTMNFMGTPFFIDKVNSLIAVGCNSKVSLTHIEPNMVGCELTSNTSKGQPSNNIPFLDLTGCGGNRLSYSSEDCTKYESEVKECDGNGCCKVGLSEPRQTSGIKIESNYGNSTKTTRKENCRVAFVTDEVYTSSNMTKPQKLFAKGYATLSLNWVIQTTNPKFMSSLSCDNIKVYGLNTYMIESEMKCICDKKKTYLRLLMYIVVVEKATQETHISRKDAKVSICSYVCLFFYVNECKTQHISCGRMNTCVNTQGDYHCVGDKKKTIVIGVSSGFGALTLVSGVWWLRKFLIKRRKEKRKKKFFKRNGGLLLQQELNTSQGNVEKTKNFSSRELEKATENFSQSRVLGQGGQGTVYKGMLVDGRTVAVKKSKVMDEDQLQEFINEVVILSQINHIHIVKLLGCCLETKVPILVYEFIINGNLFQHIHEESDDYTMIWGMRLRIAVDVAGALSYLHSSANSPIYGRDIKSTNILLAEKHRAKVADFGTYQEYYRSSQFTDKSDVYSFGVVLAELITGDKPV
ncbi:hypothetical protein F2Q70_00034167, partial [Brassica cretica]